MRLIDADALMKNYNLYEITSIIKDAPTIDPVRHGKWEKINHKGLVGVVACSECGLAHDIILYGKNYCPNCGAKMTGVERSKKYD